MNCPLVNSFRQIRKKCVSKQRNLARRGLCAAALVVLTSLSLAGTYTVTYSNTGTVSIVGPLGTSWSHGYSDYNGGRGGGDVSSEPATPPLAGMAGPGSVSCSGAITATYTWVPSYTGEPAPKNTLVREYATATFSGDSGSCADGLGDAAVGTSTSGSSSGYRLTVKTYPDTASFTTTCSPTASAYVSSNGGGEEGYLAAGASVFYKGEAWPVVVTLSGTKEDTDHSTNCLVGQRISGTLTAGPATLSSWSWTVPGEIFSSFSVQSPGQNYGRVIAVTAADLLTASPSWCWKKDGSNTVSCTATATLSGKTATVTGERLAAVARPTYNVTPSLYNHVSFETPTSQAAIGAGDYLNGLAAMTITANSSTPSLFTSQGAGQNCFVQLAKPSRSVTGGTTNFSLVKTDYCLDNGFPYSSPWAANGTNGSADDSPNQGLGDGTAFNINDNYKMYVMYLPPNSGNGSEWVPLYFYEWNWSASGSRSSSAVAWPAPPTGSVTEVSRGDTTTHPTWEEKLTNSP